MMPEEIKNKTLETMQRWGLYLPASQWHQKIERSIADRIETWNRAINDVLGPNLTETYNNYILNSQTRIPMYIFELPSIFTFGYSLAYETSRLMDNDTSRNREAGLLGGLFNLFVCLFDKICDREQGLYTGLVELINEESIIGTLELDSTKRSILFFKTTENDPLIIRITCALLKAYLEYCRNLHSVFDYSVWVEFKNGILTAYRAEIDSLHKVPLSKHADGDMYQVLFNKGALTIWITVLTAALLSFGRRTLEPLLLKSAMFNLGKSIWIADDLVDIVDDLEQGVWNYVTMKLNTEYHVSLIYDDGQIKDSEYVCSVLLSKGVIDYAADEMCKSYCRSLEELNSLGYSTNHFNSAILPWLNKMFG